MNTLFKKLTLAAALTLLSPLANGQVQCPSFDKSQLDTLQKSYQLGEPHNLGLTLAAIALKESSAGKFTINAFSADYGVYQSNYKTVCKQAHVYHDSFLCNKEIAMVVNDIEKASEHAIETLRYWLNYHATRSLQGLNYELAIRSYNEGFSFDSPKADKYYKNYKKAFYTIKQCVKFA